MNKTLNQCSECGELAAHLDEAVSAYRKSMEIVFSACSLLSVDSSSEQLESYRRAKEETEAPLRRLQDMRRYLSHHIASHQRTKISGPQVRAGAGKSG